MTERVSHCKAIHRFMPGLCTCVKYGCLDLETMMELGLRFPMLLSSREVVMPRCKRCGEKFEKDNDIQNYSPMVELGNIFIESGGDVDPGELCPDCREELGILNLMGFGE